MTTQKSNELCEGPKIKLLQHKRMSQQIPQVFSLQLLDKEFGFHYTNTTNYLLFQEAYYRDNSSYSNIDLTK